MDLTPAPPPASLPLHIAMASAKGKSTKGKRPRVWKQYYHGYVLDSAWYNAQARLRFATDDEPDAFHHRTRFLFGLLAEAGLSGGRAQFKNVKFDGGSALCIALASNSSESAMILPPQVKIEKLKSLLGTDEPPKWYEYDG
jgi:hypothetical protein